MPRRQLKEPDKSFEPLQGHYPVVILAEHSSGDFVAMQAMGGTGVLAESAAIWSTKTRQIVWRPQEVSAICWSFRRDEVFIVRNSYQRSPEHPQAIVTPLQSELSSLLERRSWPDLKLVAECPITPPMGWVVDVVASPTGTLACYVWNDQCEAGIELVSVTGNEVYQLPGLGYIGKQSNLLQGPVFNSDGRFIVFTYGRYAWWGAGGDPQTPSRGGQQVVGWIVIGEMETGNYRFVEVRTFLPVGWLPADSEDVNNEMLSCPSFRDVDSFKVILPTREEQYFSASSGRRIP